LIDDRTGTTLAAASSRDKDLAKVKGDKSEIAALVGKTIAEKSKKAGFEKVAFDRGGNLYHGRVKALAEGAREAGLIF
jgi:large subunit ribosomal protein L18